jgi:hypothetical protein
MTSKYTKEEEDFLRESEEIAKRMADKEEKEIALSNTEDGIDASIPLTPPLDVDASTADAEPADTTVTTNESYEFPINDASVQRIMENFRPKSNEYLLEILRKVSHGKLSDTGDHVPYSTLRPTVCAIGLLLNGIGQTAPRFRLVRKIKNFKSSEDRNHSNDLQVLDLHWLSLHSTVDPEPQWKEIFSGGLSFKGASKFVATLGKAANKANALGISESSQLMLSVIQTKEVADRWSTLHTGKKNAVISMRAIAAKTTSRFNETDIPNRSNEYLALRIGRGSPTAATAILPWIAGGTSTTRLMRKRKQWFTDNNISVAD